MQDFSSSSAVELPLGIPLCPWTCWSRDSPGGAPSGDGNLYRTGWTGI